MLPGLHLESAVADDFIRLRRPFLVLVHDVLVDRVVGLMREQFEEVRRRACQMNFKRLVIDSLDADLVRAAAVLIVVFRALNREQHVSVFRCEILAQRALPGIFEILCRDGIAIRPLVVTQMERVREAVLRDIPFLCCCWNRLAVLVERRQALEHLAEVRCLRNARRLARVKRLRLRAERCADRRLIARAAAAFAAAARKDRAGCQCCQSHGQ